MTQRIAVIAGARPNFVKVAPILRALTARGVDAMLIHTGQHYDEAMSNSFFGALGIPEPVANFGVGSATHGSQTAAIMTAFEAWLTEANTPDPIDGVLVVGDVNSTMACTIVAAKMGVPVSHVEAGLRSFDRTMPEEVNRAVTDALATWMFTTSPDADANLIAEGVEPERIHLVGNVMADSLFSAIERARERKPWEALDLPERFGLMTLHRPALVDDAELLPKMLATIVDAADGLPLVFPVHPRTRARLEESDLDVSTLRLVGAMDYLDFLAMEEAATVVVTDSGGVQEETSLLGTWCVTVRENTERPITSTLGTNTLVGFDEDRLHQAVRAAVTGPPATPAAIPLWDGHAAERIADILVGPHPSPTFIPPQLATTPGNALGAITSPPPKEPGDRTWNRDADGAGSPNDAVDVGIVVVTYNSARHIDALIESVPSACAGLSWRLVVVDNDSTDGTPDRLEELGVPVLRSGRNGGYAAGLNLGIRHFPNAASILVSNPDVVLLAGGVAPAIAALEEPGVGIVAPELRTFDGRLGLNQRRALTLSRAFGTTFFGGHRAGRFSALSDVVTDPGEYDTAKDLDWAVGAVLAISRRCIDTVGLWDETFFLYSEETDYCRRTRDAGLKVRYIPTPIARHEGGGGVDQPDLRAMMAVNEVRFFARHHSAAQSYSYLAARAMFQATRALSGDPAARRALSALLRPSRRPPEIGCSASLLPR